LRRPAKRKHINGLRYGATLSLLIPQRSRRRICAALKLFGAVFNDSPVPFK